MQDSTQGATREYESYSYWREPLIPDTKQDPETLKLFGVRDRLVIWDLICINRGSTTVQLSQLSGRSKGYVINECRKLFYATVINRHLVQPSVDALLRPGMVTKYIWYPLKRPVVESMSLDDDAPNQLPIPKAISICETIYSPKFIYPSRIYSTLLREVKLGGYVSLTRLSKLSKVPPSIISRYLPSFAVVGLVSFSLVNVPCPSCLKDKMLTNGQLDAEYGKLHFTCPIHGAHPIPPTAATMLARKHDFDIRLTKRVHVRAEPITTPITEAELHKKEYDALSGYSRDKTVR